jgi:hypothetical protein
MPQKLSIQLLFIFTRHLTTWVILLILILGFIGQVVRDVSVFFALCLYIPLFIALEYIVGRAVCMAKKSLFGCVAINETSNH